MDTEGLSNGGGNFIEPRVYKFGPYILDARPHKQEIRLDGKPLAKKLTDMEYSVLTFLISKSGAKVLPANFPQWGPRTDLEDKHPVVSYFSRIKTKMGDPPKGGYIRNERGIGYWFAGKLKEIEVQDDEPSPQPKLERTWRKPLVFGGVFLASAGIVAAFALYIHKRAVAASKSSTSAPAVHHLQPIGSDKAKIYLANIQGPDNENYRITDTLYSNLKQLSEKYPELEVVSLGRSIAEQEDLKPLRDDLEQKHATLLIWGWYNRTKEKVHVRLHIEPLVVSDLFSSQQMPLTVPIDRLEKLDLNLDLSNRISAISLIVEGVFLIRAQRNYKEAEHAFTEATKEKSVSALMKGNFLAAYLAIAQIQQQKFKVAEKNIKAALATRHGSDDEKALLYFLLAGTALAQNRPSSAASICRTQVIPRIDSAGFDITEKTMVATYCGAFYYEGDDRKGGDLWTHQAVSWIDTFPHERLEDHVFRGDSYFRVCAFDSALQSYKTADHLDPADPLVLVRIARTLSSRGDFTGADGYFKQVEALDPKNAQLILEHVNTLEKSGDLTQALTLSKRVEEINPTSSPAYAAEADVLTKQGNTKAAIDALGKAISFDPTNVLLYLFRARLYYQSGQRDLESSDYDSVARLDTEGMYRGLIVRRRARMLLAQGKPKDAGHEFDRAILLEPLAPAFDERGQFHFGQGETDSAIADFTKAIDLYESEKRRENCIDQSYELVGRADHADALFHRAKAFFQKGKLTAAFNDLENSSNVKDSSDVETMKALVTDAIKKHDSSLAQ